VEWRVCKRVEEQRRCFEKGFFDLVPKDLINVFDEKELEV
jgi:E3 ubiquitin-protein ligase NEDD4